MSVATDTPGCTGVAVALTVVTAAAVVWPAFGRPFGFIPLRGRRSAGRRRLTVCSSLRNVGPPSHRSSWGIVHDRSVHSLPSCRLDYVYTLDSGWNERYGLRQEIIDWKMNEARLREHAGDRQSMCCG